MVPSLERSQHVLKFCEGQMAECSYGPVSACAHVLAQCQYTFCRDWLVEVSGYSMVQCSLWTESPPRNPADAVGNVTGTDSTCEAYEARGRSVTDPGQDVNRYVSRACLLGRWTTRPAKTFRLTARLAWQRSRHDTQSCALGGF